MTQELIENARAFADDIGYLHGNGPEVRLHLRNLADTLERLTAERDAYQVAADKMAGEHKIERDALSVQVDALKAALVSFTKSDYIKKQHPKRYTAAVAAIAKESKT
jgi:hypothetical protein